MCAELVACLVDGPGYRVFTYLNAVTGLCSSWTAMIKGKAESHLEVLLLLKMSETGKECLKST